MPGKHAQPCIYHEEHTDEVGSIMVCTVHGQNSKHDVTSWNPNPPCLEMDPWDWMIIFGRKDLFRGHTSSNSD